MCLSTSISWLPPVLGRGRHGMVGGVQKWKFVPPGASWAHFSLPKSFQSSHPEQAPKLRDYVISWGWQDSFQMVFSEALPPSSAADKEFCAWNTCLWEYAGSKERREYFQRDVCQGHTCVSRAWRGSEPWKQKEARNTQPAPVQHASQDSLQILPPGPPTCLLLEGPLGSGLQCIGRDKGLNRRMEFPFDKEKPTFIKSVDVLLLLLKFLWFPFLPKYNFFTDKLRNRILTFTERTNYHPWLFLEPVYQLFEVRTFVGSDYRSLWPELHFFEIEKNWPPCSALKVKSALYFLTPYFFKEGRDSGRKGRGDPGNLRTVTSANSSWPTGVRQFRTFLVCEREMAAISSFIHSVEAEGAWARSGRMEKLRLILSGKWAQSASLPWCPVSDLFHGRETVFFCSAGLFSPGKDPSPFVGAHCYLEVGQVHGDDWLWLPR